MRSVGPTFGALSRLLRPLLDMLRPTEQGAEASLAAKEAFYRWVLYVLSVQ